MVISYALISYNKYQIEVKPVFMIKYNLKRKPGVRMSDESHSVAKAILRLLIEVRITDEGSVPGMRIWSISLIKSDCIHISRSLFF